MATALVFAMFCCMAVGVAGWCVTPVPQTLPLACILRSDAANCRSRSCASGALQRLVAAGAAPYESKRAKRRRRAPPSELHQWMAALSSRPGGLMLMLDLDNNAHAVPQLEAADAQGLQSGFEVVGFAGVDYAGPAPSWMRLRRCRVRTKNGADFVLAFEAGRVAEAARRAHGPGRDEAPTIVLVTADAGLSVIADELQQCGFQCKVVKDMEGLATMLRAMMIVQKQPAQTL